MLQHHLCWCFACLHISLIQYCNTNVSIITICPVPHSWVKSSIEYDPQCIIEYAEEHGVPSFMEVHSERSTEKLQVLRIAHCPMPYAHYKRVCYTRELHPYLQGRFFVGCSICSWSWPVLAQQVSNKCSDHKSQLGSNSWICWWGYFFAVHFIQTDVSKAYDETGARVTTRLCLERVLGYRVTLLQHSCMSRK